MARAVGIDFGTTSSAVAVHTPGGPVVIPNAEGSLTTPSVVAFTADGELLVGEAARRQGVTNPTRTVTSVKRHMGTGWSIDVDGRRYVAQEIAARILQKLKRDAETHLDEAVTRAVVTVPAYFDDAQRTATREAARIAGLDVLRIVNEPTAAALAYGFGRGDADLMVVVVHFGGGTFDVSVLEIGDGVFEVRSTHGDTRLGGDDWDQKVVGWLVDCTRESHGIDVRSDRVASTRLREVAERAKVELSQVHEALIDVPYLTVVGDRRVDLGTSLTRTRFQDLTKGLLQRCRRSLEQAMTDADLGSHPIHHVILTGGSARMPALQELVRDVTGRVPIGRPKEDVVARGAAIQAGVLTGDNKNVLLLDVIPQSLGVETSDGTMSTLIKRNSIVRTSCTEMFTTVTDNQTSIDIHVLQGEREMARDNRSLGTFRVVDLPPAPKGVPKIEVTFDTDVNGILTVSARDRGTGREQSMTFSGRTALGEPELDRMIRAAAADADVHRRRTHDVATRVDAEALETRTGRDLAADPGRYGPEVPRLLRALRAALRADDLPTIRAAAAALKHALE